MKKLFLAVVAAGLLLGMYSCETESTAETDTIYAIDRDKVVPPGEKG